MTPCLEIERKFLVDRVPGFVDSGGCLIEQGYVALDVEAGVEVRVRSLCSSDDACGGFGVLTVKRGVGVRRSEVEVGLGEVEAAALWSMTAGRRVRKRRYGVRVGGVFAEVDVYEGPHEGLVVVEVEFASEGEARAFEPPAWFGREVTGEAAYTNASLAARGCVPSGGGVC